MLTAKTCKQCGKTFSGGPRAWYCPACREERRAKHDKDYKRRKRTGAHRPLGSIDQCVICGQDYTVNAGQQRYCPRCAVGAVKAIDRSQGLSYYHVNKDAINPARNLKRRKGLRQCPICKTQFDTRSKRICCSDECRRAYINANWRARYHLRKANK